MWFFFFFQAEDGIRDYKVTGVQTCALPIFIVMVKGTSFMGLGGPNLVKGATGQTIDSETLGGAATHTETSGVAHYSVDNDGACLTKLRELVAILPPQRKVDDTTGAEPDASRLYDLLPADH